MWLARVLHLTVVAVVAFGGFGARPAQAAIGGPVSVDRATTAATGAAVADPLR